MRNLSIMFVALARQDDKSKWGKGVAVIIKFYLGWRWRIVAQGSRTRHFHIITTDFITQDTTGNLVCKKVPVVMEK
jgi:hypothetical protein